jgi:hypothetical protein
MAYATCKRYISEERASRIFWRPFRVAIGVGSADAEPECHLLCQKWHPLRNNDIYSKKLVFIQVFDFQPI